MGSDNAGPFVASAALALCAAVLGSVLTLAITGSIQVPELNNGSAREVPVTSDGTPVLSGADQQLRANENIELFAYVEPSDDSVDELRQSLQDASDERSQLAQSIARLTAQIESLQSDSINETSRAVLDQATQDEPDTAIPVQADNGRDRRTQRRFDSLLAAGLDETAAEDFLSQQNQYQLARLELFDLAEREGWADSEQFDVQLGQLNDTQVNLREELGDEGYDRYLFEAGRNNRVVIQSVIPGSEAEAAGLQAGDTVMNYANERIFSTRELQQATREGERGELVDVAVNRQGQSLFFDVARGPLGVSLGADKENPS